MGIALGKTCLGNASFSSRRAKRKPGLFLGNPGKETWELLQAKQGNIMISVGKLNGDCQMAL